MILSEPATFAVATHLTGVTAYSAEEQRIFLKD
jgi:hypothetical protein